MNKIFKNIVLIVSFLSIGLSNVSAQIDTVFWFAAPWVTPDHFGNTPNAFHFSTFNNATTVRLRQPSSVFDTTFVVPANSLFTKYVTHIVDSLESKPADVVLNCGFEITSDYPIVAVYDFLSNFPQQNNPETYSLKGQNGMGYEFVLPFQTLWDNKILTNDRNGDGTITQPKQYFSVVATEDNTTIYIKPKCAVEGHPANVTYSVFLPFAGNVYTCQNAVQNTSVAGNNLAGSIVVADKQVSVTVNDDSVNPTGPGGGCYDLMGDQVVPTDVIGTDYIVNKGFVNAGSNESMFIVATENFTTVNIDDGVTTTSVILNQGDSYQSSITEQLTYAFADKNVYVLHMSGYGCELGEALIPPLNCAGSDQVSFPRTNDKSFLLNIVCPAGSEGDFLVNTDPTIVEATDFSVVPGTGGAWMGAQVDIPISVIDDSTSNFIENTSELFSLGIINGTATGGCLYHYLSTFLRRVVVDAGSDVTLCSADNGIDLVGSVSGGTTSGIWSVLDGSGTLSTPSSLLTNYVPVQSDLTQGSLTFVLESTGNCDPRYDTMKVSFIQSPITTVGLDDSYCKNNVPAVPISGTVQYAVGATWSGGAGGSFDNVGDLSTTYLPSLTDLDNDSVALFLTSGGSLFSCPNDVDTVVIYFTEPPSVFPGSDQTICAGAEEVNLSGSVLGATGTGIWTTNGTGAFAPSEVDLTTDYLLTQADTAAGSVWFNLTSTNNGGCLPVTDSLEIVILDQPTIEITAMDSVCSNLNIINLSGSVSFGLTTQWGTYGSGTVDNPTSLNTFYNIHPSDTALGYVDIILETTGGFCPQILDSVRISFINPPSAFAGLDTNLCDNVPIQLNGSVTGIATAETWSTTGTGGFTPSVNFLSAIYQPSSGDVSNGSVNLILTADNSFGCPSYKDTLNIVFKETPQAGYQFSTSCQGVNTVFTDQSTISTGSVLSWTWDFGDMTGSIANNPLHPYPGSGDFDAELIVQASNGCSDTIVQTITIDPTPVASFETIPACLDEETIFTDNSFISGGSIISTSYDFGDGSALDLNPDTQHMFTSLGSFGVTYTVVSDQGCTDVYSEIVSVLPGPDADFSLTPNPALALEDIDFTDLSAGNGIISWYWEFGDGDADNSQNTVHNYTDGGAYTVELTVVDDQGCSDTTQQDLLVALLPVVPTAFTPNGDLENDVFLIRGGPFVAVDFKVYSNWGELIFQSDDALIGWDGTYKSEDAQLGVYTWTFEVEMPGGDVIRKSGDVTLLR